MWSQKTWRVLQLAYAMSAVMIMGATTNLISANESLDGAITALWTAESESAIAKAVNEIVATNPSVDELWKRLHTGREYSAQVPTGRHIRSRRNRDGLEHLSLIHISEPTRPY